MYYPTIRSLKREYGLLNKRVFNGCLPDSSEIEFEIGNMSDALGICKYIITRDTLAIKVLPEFKTENCLLRFWRMRWFIYTNMSPTIK